MRAAADHVLIGPPQAGKTSLLAAVLEMAGNSYTDHPGPLPSFRAHDSPGDIESPVQALRCQLEEALHNGGVLASTGHQARHYELFMSQEGARWGTRTAAQHIFSLVDGGGELLMPGDTVTRDASYAQGRQAHLAALRQARGVLLCLPAYPRLPWHLQEGMREVMSLLRSPLCKVERLVICLTKYECATAIYGSRAFDLAQREEVFIDRVIPDVLGIDFLASLQMLSTIRQERRTPVEIVITPVSVYGFIGRNGCANLDPWHPPGTGGMLLQIPSPTPDTASGIRDWPLYEESAVRRRWIPYRILEPFTYLLTGQGGRLTIPLDTVVQRTQPRPAP